jgi:cytoskeletal protein CcmA (bactofilin family)
MKRKDILERLEERLARGEISEKTYLDIKARYEAEPEEAETPPAPGPSLEESIHENVSRATDAAFQASQESMRAVNESMQAMKESMKQVHDSVRSIEFSGMGVRVSGEEIRIAGTGVVSGNPVETVEFRASGSAQVRGPLECESATVSGACDFDGDIHCVDFRSSGASRIAGSLDCQDLDASGAVDVSKDVHAVDISTSGALRVDGNVSCQDFDSHGSVRIQGALKAQDVNIELGGDSRIGSIEGQDISVRVAGTFMRSRGDLVVDRVVGQDVDLLRTTANYVQGNEVRIGPHCRIGVVVAQDLVVHESSEVKERRAPNAG